MYNIIRVDVVLNRRKKYLEVYEMNVLFANIERRLDKKERKK